MTALHQTLFFIALALVVGGVALYYLIVVSPKMHTNFEALAKSNGAMLAVLIAVVVLGVNVKALLTLL